MRVAIIVRRLDGKGGTQRQALILARELASRGHGIKLYALRFDAERCYPDLLRGLSVTALTGQMTPNEEKHAAFLERVSGFLHETYLAKCLARRIDRDIDVLNPHDSVAYRAAHYFKKQEARSKKQTPSVWVMNDVPALRWTFDRIAAFEPVRLSPFRRFVIRLIDWYDRNVFIKSQDTIVVLDRFNRGLVKKYLGRESVITRLGIDAGQFAFIPHSPPAGRRVRLLAVGIFFPHRCFEDIIEAVSLLRKKDCDVVLSVVGNPKPSPAYAARLGRLVADRGLEAHVTFAGEVSEADLIRAYRENDIFVFSNCLQTWGHVPLEAMAMGIPAIVSKGAGVHEVLADGETALLVAPRAPAEIARAVERLLSDPGLYAKLVRQGSEFVRKNITWSGYAEVMLALFEQALSKSKIKPGNVK